MSLTITDSSQSVPANIKEAMDAGKSQKQVADDKVKKKKTLGEKMYPTLDKGKDGE